MQFIDEYANYITIPDDIRKQIKVLHKHILPDSVVLELGAKYGFTSCAINTILDNSLNQVSIEPDPTVFPAFEINMNINKCKINAIKGVISTKNTKLNKLKKLKNRIVTIDSTTENIKTYSLEQIEELHGLKFTTLVADCNGALQKFFEENSILYTQLNTVIFNKTFNKKCNYATIKEKLRENKFKQLVKGKYEVWKKV
jgi:FkbM family methyltransferase